jgi:hypothetical protein
MTEDGRFAAWCGAIAGGAGFRMLIVARHARKIREFRHTIHQGSDNIAKIPLDLVKRDRGVFHRIVQQTGSQYLGWDTQIGKDLGDCQAMVDVGLARNAFLAAVSLLGHNIGALNQFPIRK